MFRSDAQDHFASYYSGPDLYDESQDKWTALQAGFDSSFTGLVLYLAVAPKAGTST
jgi:hypothetical protein